jgi:hypothetical protein
MNKTFEEILRDEIDIFYMRKENPTAKDFIGMLDSESSKVIGRHKIEESNESAFFEYAKTKESLMDTRLSNLTSVMDKILGKIR